MAKPSKPTEFLPNGFGTASGVPKADFSDTKKLNGFSSNIEDILQGDNLNYMLDTIGKELNYLKTVVDYIRDIDGGKVPFITSSEMTAKTFDELLPTQAGNAGKFLTTNGTTSSWGLGSSRIGDPIFTLDFGLTVSPNSLNGSINNIVASSYTDLVNNNKSYIWLDGTQYNVPTENDVLYGIFQIYGYTYSENNSGSKFRVPNLLNRVIWGGSTAGYIDAGLPNIKGFVYGSSQISSTNFDNNWDAETEGVRQNAFTVRGGGVKIFNSGEKDNMYNFDAHRCSDVYKNGITTVQPPAIKVRAYTRVK